MESLRRRKLRVVLISHAYIPEETQKNLSALANNVELKAIVHRWHPNLRTREGDVLYGGTCLDDSSIIEWVRPIYIRGQSVLCPFGKVLRAHEPDIIYLEYALWSPLTIETVALAKVYAPRAKIVLFDKKNTYIPKSFVLDKAKLYFRRVIDKKISAYIAASNMTKNMYIDLLGIRPEKLHVCYHLGVDLNLFSPKNRHSHGGVTDTVIGYCGQMRSRKGIPELVEAVRRLVTDKRLPLQLRLLGGGPLRGALAKEAENSSWLRLEGPVPQSEVAPFLQECDVFAFPSRNEPDHQEHDAHGLMEAMAVGLPAITTKSGIIHELSDTQAAFFVQENSPGQIADRIEQLAGDSALRRDMGSHARSIAERDFGLSTLAQKKADIFRKVCDERTSS